MNAFEKERPSSEDRTLKDLSPYVAGLLCYVAGWISGIVFLVIEQKNRFVRFHALQSIIVFGTFFVAGAILGRIPFFGTGFSIIIGITAFVFWIVLMIKALNGEYFKMPWAGNLAERLTTESLGSTGAHNTTQDVPAGATEDEVTRSGSVNQNIVKSQPDSMPAAAASSRTSRSAAFQAKYYSSGARIGRVAGSAFVIAWSIALLIFFNYFHQYIAYYQPSYWGGITHWQITPLVTSDFNVWLPIVSATLILGIVGHILMIVFDKYLLRESGEIVLSVLSLVAIISLLVIFPFDFSVIPNTDAAYWIPVGLTITLILIAVGIVIGTIIRFIRLIVNVAESKY